MKMHSFLLVLILLNAVSATPRCCDLTNKCVMNNRASLGDYRIGSELTEKDAAACGTTGRANWCVAQWKDGNWWCTSPGNFLKSLSGYAPQCEGGVFPTKGKKAPCFGAEECDCGNADSCNVALKDLQRLVRKLRNPSNRCVVAVNQLKCD